MAYFDEPEGYTAADREKDWKIGETRRNAEGRFLDAMQESGMDKYEREDLFFDLGHVLNGSVFVRQLPEKTLQDLSNGMTEEEREALKAAEETFKAAKKVFIEAGTKEILQAGDALLAAAKAVNSAESSSYNRQIQEKKSKTIFSSLFGCFFSKSHKHENKPETNQVSEEVKVTHDYGNA